MTRFSIFKESKKFYWSKNRIIYFLFIVLMGSIWIKRDVLHIESQYFDDFLAGLIGIGVIVLIIAMILGLSKPDPLRGKLEGFITFKIDSIEVGDETIPLSEIQNIKITNDDYYGKMIPRGKGNFNSPLSNGVDNSLVLTMLSNQKKAYNYELYYSDDLQKVRKELINYFYLGKLSFTNLCNVLGDKTQSEITELKIEIERGTAANNG